MKITSKRKFFELWEQNLLGNRTLLWRNLEDALASGAKRIGFRQIGTAGGGAWELADRANAPEVYARWKAAGRNFIMDGSVPNDKATLQGEVCRTELGLQSFLVVREQLTISNWLDWAQMFNQFGRYFPDPGMPPMRQTIAAGWHKHRNYLETRLLLAHYMDPASRDDLDTLLELYPLATVEFTCFSINTGVIPGRNTIFWEVRDY